MEIKTLIPKYQEYVQQWRRYFHEHPELSNEEFERQKHWRQSLIKWGFLILLTRKLEQVL